MRRVLPLLLLAAACSGPSAPHHPSQRVVYRDVDAAGAVSTTTVDLAPPYRARVLISGDGRSSGFAWDESGLYTLDGSSAVRTAVVAPGFPGPWSRLDVALPVAREQRLVTRAGTGTVLGRACTKWLSAEPFEAGALAPATPTNRTTSCVDATGHLLSESWYADARLVRTRTATFVGDGPSLDGSALYGGTPTPGPTSATSAVVRTAPRRELLDLLQVPEPRDPAGFHPDAAAAVVDPGTAGAQREAAVLTWLRGTQLVVLRLERDLSGASRSAVRGAPVELGALGSGHLEPVLAGLKVVVDGPRQLRAIVTADLPPAELLAWVRTLRFQPGP